MATTPQQVMNRNNDDKKKNKSSYNGTEDTNYYLAQQSNAEVSIPDSWRNNPYVPSSNQINNLIDSASQPKEIQKGKEDASIHKPDTSKEPEFVRTSFANKDSNTYQKSIDDVKRGQVQRKQNPLKDVQEKADYWTKRLGYTEQPTDSGISGYIKTGGESIADSARNWFSDVSSQLFNREPDQNIISTRLQTSENLDGDAVTNGDMLDEVNNLIFNSEPGISNYQNVNRIESSKNLKLPEDNVSATTEQARNAWESLSNAIGKASEPLSKYAPQDFNRQREQALGSFGNNLSNAVGTISEAARPLFDDRQQPINRFNATAKSGPEDISWMNSIAERELANFIATIPNEELDNAKSIYEEYFLQQDPNIDLGTENALFNAENLARLWEEAQAEPIPDSEAKSQYDIDVENGYPFSGTFQERAEELFPDNPSEYWYKRSGATGKFLELFEEQLDQGSIDDGTNNIDNLTSVWMTGEQYKNYIDQLGLRGRDNIEDDGIYNKYQEYIDYGFIPYLPDDYSRIKFRIEGLAHAGEQIYGDFNNIRNDNTDFEIDLGDGVIRNGKELYESVNDFYDNVPEEDYITFQDPNADHSNHQLYVPMYAYIMDHDGHLQQVPGGQYRTYSVEGTDDVFVTFSDGFSYLFDDENDFRKNFANLDNNKIENVTEWVLCTDPNMFQTLNTGDNVGSTGYLYGIDYVDENGKTIPFWKAQQYLNYYNDGDLSVYNADFGPLGISKPAHMVAHPTEWITNPSTYGENLLPLMLDVGAGSSPFMLPGKLSAFGDYIALGGALSGGSNVEGLAHTADNVYRRHEEDDGRINDDVAKILIDNGFMTQEEIDEYNDYTPYDRALYMLTTGLMNQGEKVSEFLVDKPGRPLKNLVNRIPNRGARVVGNALLGAGSEALEEQITNPLGEIGEWGWDYSYGNELKDENGNPILDSKGDPVRVKNTTFLNRVSNSFNQDAADQAIAAGLFGFLLNALTSTVTTKQEKALRRSQMNRLNEAISNNDSEEVQDIYNEVTNQTFVVPDSLKQE